jgi:hypothetical protein
MRRLIFTLLTFLGVINSGFGQCCPYVDPIEIIPASPGESDSIYVVTNVTTPNQGEYLGYTIIDGGSDIRIEACYYNGMLTALQSYTDTINLGVKNAGTYDIHFVAYLSGSNTMCTYSDSNEVSASTTVYLALAEEPLPKITIYPNPVNDSNIYLSGKPGKYLVTYRLYNLAGETELKGTLSHTNSIDVSGLKGIYFLEILYEGHVSTEKVFIR